MSGVGDRVLTKLQAEKASGATLESLLETAVEELHGAWTGRFSWTGVYELREDGRLHLGPFRGPATDHTVIDVGQGVCGSAVAEERNRNVPDVRAEANYLACSLTVRSELVVLIRDAAGRIRAQIDIDSEQVDAFDDAIEADVQLVADWLGRRYRSRYS